MATVKDATVTGQVVVMVKIKGQQIFSGCRGKSILVTYHSLLSMR